MNKSYVMWNNKGGVGKSTITFHIASVYAEKNPDRDVVVIDMCPQANSSMMLLGGGKEGEEELLNLIQLDNPKSVVGFLTDKITNKNDALDNYLTKLVNINKKLTDNIYLLAGDGKLELIAPLLSERADAKPLSSSDNPWVSIHTILKELTELRVNRERPCTYFIDTNPSFSIYTQMAILAGEHLLVPINADDSSIYAITGLFNLIWGTNDKESIYSQYTFASKVDSYKLQRPQIALLLGNRFTQKKGAAHAFKALSNAATEKMYAEFQKNPDKFVGTENEKNISSKAEFEELYSIELRDFNSAGVVSANQGLPVSKMTQHSYEVYGENIQVSQEQRDLCKDVIFNLVKRL